jgi:hypothetical protein
MVAHGAVFFNPAGILMPIPFSLPPILDPCGVSGDALKLSQGVLSAGKNAGPPGGAPRIFSTATPSCPVCMRPRAVSGVHYGGRCGKGWHRVPCRGTVAFRLGGRRSLPTPRPPLSGGLCVPEPCGGVHYGGRCGKGGASGSCSWGLGALAKCGRLGGLGFFSSSFVFLRVLRGEFFLIPVRVVCVRS